MEKLLSILKNIPLLNSTCELKAHLLSSPLGPLLAIGDEKKLHLLEFLDYEKLPKTLERLVLDANASISLGITPSLTSIQTELEHYFKKELIEFKTPLCFHGSSFQKKVWHHLQKIPLGQTFSYLELAKTIQQPKAFRAVAQANGANYFVIVVPCHRVKNANGGLGGYSSGLFRKKWLLDHEQAFKNN